MESPEAASHRTQIASINTPPIPARPFILVVGVVLLVGSVALNLVLAHKVHSLMLIQALKGSPRTLSIGTIVPPFPVKDLNGENETISYQAGDKPTVLYIFTPPCTWCERNMDNLRTLVDKAGSNYRFLGLSLSEEGLAQYVAKNNLELPIYSGLSPETREVYKLAGTPQTIVVSPEGRVLQDWMGAYEGSKKSQVEAFFHVTLPGIRPLR